MSFTKESLENYQRLKLLEKKNMQSLSQGDETTFEK